MSQYIGLEPKEYPHVHCAPEVLVSILTPDVDPKIMAAWVESQLQLAMDKLPKA